MRTTFIAKTAEIERKWYVVDAEGCTLGRLSSEIAKVLRGKNKPEYTPHVVKSCNKDTDIASNTRIPKRRM